MKRIVNVFITTKLTCRELMQKAAKLAIRPLMFIRNKSPQRLAVNVQRLVSALSRFRDSDLTVHQAIATAIKENRSVTIPKANRNIEAVKQIKAGHALETWETDKIITVFPQPKNLRHLYDQVILP